MEGEALHWIEVRIVVPETDSLELETLEGEILAVTPGGFASESWDAPPLPGEREPVPLGKTRYLVYMGEHALEPALLALSRAVARWPTATLSTVPLDDGWRERWKRYFVPLQASPRFVVAPPWETPEIPPGQHLLVIEPAMAFGTAQHETTALCLVAVDEAYRTTTPEPGPRRVLDVGSGTGILGLAAAMLGAERVLGVDVDSAAVLAARDNVRLNPTLAERDIAFSDTPVGEVAGVFDLVVANILTPTLLMLAPEICSRVAPGGALHLSGILADQSPDIVAAFVAEGLAHRGTEERNGWVRVDFARAPDVA
jgi:ribosomal protein L11 methyltransferase